MHSSSPDVPHRLADPSSAAPTSAGATAARGRVGPPPPAATPEFKDGASRRASRELNILTIAHNAVADSNRRRVDALSTLPSVHVSLLTPSWWFEEGRRIDVPRAAPWRIGRTAFSGNNGSWTVG